MSVPRPRRNAQARLDRFVRIIAARGAEIRLRLEYGFHPWCCTAEITPHPNRRGVPDASFVAFSVSHNSMSEALHATLDYLENNLEAIIAAPVLGKSTDPRWK